MKLDKLALAFPISLVLYEIAIYLSNDMFLPGLPSLAQDLNTTPELAQDTLLYWFLGSASMQLFMGPLSDRFGRRIVILTGGVFYILSSLICAITHDITLMLIARFIQGSTVCSVVVAGYAAIHEKYDTRMAIKIIAIMGSITILAPAFGPLLGAVIIELGNWRDTFYILAIWAFIGIVLLYKLMPETNHSFMPIHLKSILTDYYKISVRIPFLATTIPSCLIFLALIEWVVESPFIIIQTYERTVLEFGYIQAVVFIGYIAGAQLTQRLVSTHEPLRVIRYGLLISLLSAIGLVLNNVVLKNPLYIVVGLLTVLAFGTAMAFGPLHRLSIDACHEPMGRRMAVSSSFVSFFGAFATWIVARFANNQMGGLSYHIAIAIFLAYALFVIAKKRGVLDHLMLSK